MSGDETIVSTGGLLAPPADLVPPYFAVVTVKPWRERIRCFFRGEPGFDVDVYCRDDLLYFGDSLPRFTAARGGVEFR